jgi:hypothetical protein
MPPSIQVFNAIHTDLTLGSLLDPEQHTAMVVASAPWAPLLAELQAVFCRAHPEMFEEGGA